LPQELCLGFKFSDSHLSYLIVIGLWLSSVLFGFYFVHDYSFESSFKENNLNHYIDLDKPNFLQILWFNSKICIGNMFGAVTLGISCVISVILNGFQFGLILYSLIFNSNFNGNLLTYFLSYSITENFAFIISAKIGIDFIFFIFRSHLYQQKVNLDFNKLIFQIFVMFILLVFSSFFEVYFNFKWKLRG